MSNEFSSPQLGLAELTTHDLRAQYNSLCEQIAPIITEKHALEAARESTEDIYKVLTPLRKRREQVIREAIERIDKNTHGVTETIRKITIATRLIQPIADRRDKARAASDLGTFQQRKAQLHRIRDIQSRAIEAVFDSLDDSNAF